MRRASTWITNVKQGGQPLAIAPDPKMERLAIAAAEAVGAAIAGVDVLVAADGAPTVLEVNSMPAWSGLQKVSKRNIAEAIASALMDDAGRRPVATARSHERLRRSSGGGLYRRVPCGARRAQTGQRASVRAGHRMEVEDFVRSAEASAAPDRGKGSAGRNPCPRRRRRDALRRSVRTPISASSSCARRSRRPRRPRTWLCARRWRGCSIVSTATDARRRLLRHSRRQSWRPRTRASA